MLFQFLNGTIGVAYSEFMLDPEDVFQFLNGTIGVSRVELRFGL